MDYIEAYLYYVQLNHVDWESIKKEDILLPRLPILDFAAGGGHRTLELIEWAKLEGIHVRGCDRNPKWQPIWEENVSRLTDDYLWTDTPPHTWEGTIHLSHAFYMPEARDKCLDLYRKSKGAMVVRGFDRSSIFNELISAWDLPENKNWEDILKDVIDDKNWNYNRYTIPTIARVPDRKVSRYAQAIKTFVKGSGGQEVVEELIRDCPKEKEYLVENSDVIYLIDKQ